MRTNCSGFVYGNGLNRAALITLKMAVVTPMPSASVRVTITVKPGLRASCLRANRRSFMVERNVHAKGVPSRVWPESDMFWRRALRFWERGFRRWEVVGGRAAGRCDTE